jgi:hypothetical protein
MTTLRQAVTGSASFTFMDILLDAAEAALAEARQARAKRAQAAARRPARGLTLRPGLDTPLWNELVKQVRPHLRRYGAKAQLARLLGLPRQRLQDCLKAKTACLDAERTLLLLGWLGFFQRGGELIPVVRPGRPRRKPGSSIVPGNV